MTQTPKIGRRLARAFLLQAVFIVAAAMLGIYAAKFVLEDILIRQALTDEAEHFWIRFASQSDFPVPDTHNMRGYLLPRQAASELPPFVGNLSPGFHDLSQGRSFTAAYVSERESARLILVFDGSRVERLALVFGMAPLGGLLGVVYLGAWFSYRVSRRAVSPVVRLAEELKTIDLESPGNCLSALENLPKGSDEETRAVSEALTRLFSRLQRFIERERTFTRDVSHELRSPITVIKIATELLLSDQYLDARIATTVNRIRRAAKDMEELTEAFLLLARESEQPMRQHWVCVNDIAMEELERARPLLAAKPVAATMQADHSIQVVASEKVLSVLIGNLIRNAFGYTEAGSVSVQIGPDRICIEDSGVGMALDHLGQVFKPFFRGTGQGPGHGVGLTIVKRLSDRFGWSISIESEPGKGTRVTVQFPGARAIASS